MEKFIRSKIFNYIICIIITIYPLFLFDIFQFDFNLYFEVKRISLEDKPLKEMDGEKRIWMKEEGMTPEIYRQHLRPTAYNTDLKILTTQHYVPEYLKRIFSKNTGNFTTLVVMKLNN